MSVPTISIPVDKLVGLGLRVANNIHYQLSPEELVQDTLRLGEGVLNDTGALVIKTGEFTGRSPKDKFIVKDDLTADSVNWTEFNQPIEQKYFDQLYKKMLGYLDGKELWIRDCCACADQEYRLNIRAV